MTRLQQTFSRVESSWRPASQEESYEIVRRRLFKEIPGDMFQHRDNTLKQFAKLYRDGTSDFPRGSAGEDYRRKLGKAYPIHPELFDQFYTGWGSLEKFQRTRGILRLMAQVIHELWMDNDPSVMIMPGNVEISSPRVQPELMHYLDTNWQSIIAGDIDGPSSTPFNIDRDAPNLNRYSATRRVARTVFIGSAPTYKEQNKGLDDKQINLGVVQPGEKPTIFSDALRRLSNQTKFMHSEHGRYWYSISPSLNRIATDRAAQLEEALVVMKIEKALNKYINGPGNRGHFDAVQAAPASSAEVPDEAGGVRAVVLGIGHPHLRNGSEAVAEAKRILKQRGNIPRVNRNVLVFLAADGRQLGNLKEAMRLYLAWNGITQQPEQHDLRTSDIARAETKRDEAEETMKTRLREAWCYLIYPVQERAEADVEWISGKIPTQDGLLERASRKLVNDSALLPELGPNSLDYHLKKYLWNDKPHLSLKNLWEYVSRCIYLPRLKDQAVLTGAIRAAIGGTIPGPFAYAERWDSDTGKYEGLVALGGTGVPVTMNDDSVIVRATVAEQVADLPEQATGRSDKTSTETTDGATMDDTPEGPGTQTKTDPLYRLRDDLDRTSSARYEQDYRGHCQSTYRAAGKHGIIETGS